jgi:photosystem II stability/assembly factor-like uncharacterized protein
MKKLVVTIGILAAMVAHADWTSIGPEGGPMYCGTVAPGSPPTVYMASSNTSTPLLKTSDGGANWETTAGVLGNYPWKLAAHPSDPNTLFGVVSTVFYRSTDAGATWNQYSLGSNTIGYDIAVNPLNPQVIYSAGYWYDGSAWRLSSMKSTNGGQNWSVVQLDTASNAYGYACALDPVDTTIVYAGGYASSLTAFFRSTDCGATWTRVTWPANAYYIYSLAVSPVDHNIVFAGTLYGVYRSTDCGLSWAQQSTANYNYCIAVAPDNPNIMYSAVYTGVSRSTDAGLTWTTVTSGIQGTNIRVVLTVPGENGTVYCGSTAGVFKSTDYGLTWTSVNHGILIGKIPVVSFDPTQTGTAFAEFIDNAVFKTTDDGVTWERQPTVLSCGNVCNIIIEPGNPLRRWMFEASG